MSLHMFMKIDGVTGGARDYKHKGWSEVLSWNWGMTSNRKSTQGDDNVKTSFNEISVVKPTDIDSPDIRLLFAQGKVIPAIEFSITPVVAKRQVEGKYMSIKLEDIVIKSIVTGGSVEDNFFKEHVTLLFDRINFEFTKADDMKENVKSTGSHDFHFKWDVAANSEWAQ